MSHTALILPAAGAAMEVTTRPTPTPGPGQVLLAPHAVALNPVDMYQRDLGFAIEAYPTVLGSDIGGEVIAVGPGVTHVAAGDRVMGFASSFYYKGQPDYGALQQRVLGPAATLARLPANMDFGRAAALPMGVATSFSAMHVLGLPPDTKLPASERAALLVHGAASAIGCAGIQIARHMGFTVYATAGPAHHAYLKQLGAARVFDYKDAGIVDAIVAAARADNLTLTRAYYATGSLDLVIAILDACRGTAMAQIAHAPPFLNGEPKHDGFEIKFVQPPQAPPDREAFHRQAFAWLEERLAANDFESAPPVSLVPGGLAAVSAALDRFKEGVSCTKLVIEMD